MIRTLIIEDILNNREALKKLLASDCPEVEIIGEADSVLSGFDLILQKKPDLVFLDIQLKDGTGFDILSRLLEKDKIEFEIIFFTAHGNFENATKAIEYSALDFITKPIDPSKLCQAVNKFEKKVDRTQYNTQIALLLENIAKNNSKGKRIAIHLSKGIIEFVEVDEIVYLEADATITNVYLLRGNKLTAMKNLGFYSKLLMSDYNFFPISNSLVVNLDFIKRYNHSELAVVLTSGKTIYASRRGGQDFRKFLNDNKSQYGDIQPQGIGQLLKKLLGG